jgi:hypothetical protein
MADTRKLRRAQTVTPVGVGAIFDRMGESFTAEDISKWQLERAKVLRAPRLASALGVERIRTAPQAPSRGSAGPGVPFYRFPSWLFCSRCRRMTRWHVTSEEPDSAPRCVSCSGKLVPMRFIMICSKGHMDDVDWRHWAHSKTDDPAHKSCQEVDKLEFRIRKGVGSGLESLEIVCKSCGSRRSLKGIASPGSARGVGMSCRGKQPWQHVSEASRCTESPAIVQRGAANVHFPVVASALDIPPDSDWSERSVPSVRITNNPYFQLLLAAPDSPMRDQLIGMAAQEEGVDRDTVVVVLNIHRGSSTSAIPADMSLERIIHDEWNAFRTPRVDSHPRDNFVISTVHLGDARVVDCDAGGGGELLGELEDLVRATRLHEVRALKGFYRFEQAELVRPDLGRGTDWLPGIEVFGEGIFISLRPERVRDWEARPDVAARVAPLIGRYAASHFSKWLPDPTPRLILLHTLAHLLIRQLTFDTGYSSSSLRERLYSSSDPSSEMAGLLIYTAAGDSEGTLGGLVRQGEASSFGPTLAAALRLATWCSLDPICRESSGQGSDALNLASCHGCSLGSETSCVNANCLLDRSLLVDPDIGFFAQQLNTVLRYASEVA